MARKRANSLIKGFLGSRDAVEDDESSFDANLTSSALINNYIKSHRPAPDIDDINKSLVAEEQTPRRIMKKLLRSKELPKASTPVHPLTPSPDPASRKPSSSAKRRKVSTTEDEPLTQTGTSSPYRSPNKSTTTSSPNKGTPKKAATTPKTTLKKAATPNKETPKKVATPAKTNLTSTPSKSAPSTPTKTPSTPKQASTSTPNKATPSSTRKSTRLATKQTDYIHLPEELIANTPGSPTFDSQEDPDATIDSGTFVEPEEKAPSQDSNISYVSSGLGASPSREHAVPNRKERARKRGKRNSRILDTTSDKSGDISQEEEGENDGIMSPSFDSPPPSPGFTTSTSKSPRPPVSYGSQDSQQSSNSTTTTTTTTIQEPDSPTLSSQPTPTKPSPRKTRQSMQQSAQTTDENNTSIPLPTPPDKWTRRKQKADAQVDTEQADSDEQNTSAPLPTPPDKWTRRKQKAGAQAENPVTPEKLRDTVEPTTTGPSPRRTPVRAVREPRSIPKPVPTPQETTIPQVESPEYSVPRFSLPPRDSLSSVLVDQDVSLPFETPQAKWKPRGAKRKLRHTSLPDDEDTSGGGQDEEESIGESVGEEAEEEEVQKIVRQSHAPRSPQLAPVDLPSNNEPLDDLPPFQLFRDTPKLRPASPPIDVDEYNRAVFTDSPFPITLASAAQNMAAYKKALGKAPLVMPKKAARLPQLVGGPKAKRDMEKKKLAQKRKIEDPDESEIVDDVQFPKKITEETYYDFSRKKISKPAMRSVHKGVNHFWKWFCREIDQVRVDEGKGKRKKITLSDVKILAERLRFTNEMVDFNSLLRENLPKELQECLIPIARAGNVVGVKKV